VQHYDHYAQEHDEQHRDECYDGKDRELHAPSDPHGAGQPVKCLYRVPSMRSRVAPE